MLTNTNYIKTWMGELPELLVMQQVNLLHKSTVICVAQSAEFWTVLSLKPLKVFFPIRVWMISRYTGYAPALVIMFGLITFLIKSKIYNFLCVALAYCLKRAKTAAVFHPRESYHGDLNIHGNVMGAFNTKHHYIKASKDNMIITKLCIYNNS